MQTTYKRYAPIAVVVGLVGLVGAAGIWLIQQQFNTYVQASLAVGLLGLAVAVLLDPGAVQAWAGRRQARYGANAALMVVAVLGIAILANYLVVQNAKQWDLTANKINTLAPETLAAIKELPAPVKAIGFYSTRLASTQTTAKNLYEQYRVASGGKFTYEFHDTVGDPALARQYNIGTDGTTVLIMGTHQEQVTNAAEADVTGALIRLMHPTARGVYVTTGHGELGIDSTAQRSMSTVVDLLKAQNYTVKPIDLTVTSTVPTDTRVLVVAGPLVPLSQQEVNVITAYMLQGGALVVMLDPTIATQAPVTATDPLATYLAQTWGLTLDNDVVVDLYNSITNQPLYPLNSTYGSSLITSRLQNIRTVFPVARSVSYPAAGTGFTNTTFSALVTLDPAAWGETNFIAESNNGQQLPTLDATDIKGPLNVAVSAEDSTTHSRVVVFGNSAFASNTGSSFGANATLLVNTIDWSTVDESLINLTQKTPTTPTLQLTNALTVNAIFVITVILMPLLVLVFGGVVWFRRRQHV